VFDFADNELLYNFFLFSELQGKLFRNVHYSSPRFEAGTINPKKEGCTNPNIKAVSFNAGLLKGIENSL